MKSQPPQNAARLYDGIVTVRETDSILEPANSPEGAIRLRYCKRPPHVALYMSRMSRCVARSSCNLIQIKGFFNWNRWKPFESSTVCPT
jgi:hypothetical protein